MEGIFYSLGAGFFWAVAVILYKKSSDQFSPFSLNLYKSFVTLIMLVITMLILKIPFFPDHPPENWIRLSISGFFGIAVADILFFSALSKLGASMMAIIECVYLPAVLLMSFLFLGDSLSMASIAGGSLVVTAIFIGSISGKQVITDRKKMISGIATGLISIVFIALGIIIIKMILEQTNVFWATYIRIFAGTFSLLVILIFHPRRRKILNELKFSRAWLTALPASIVGNYLALIFWLAGMKYTTVSKAAVLNQMSTIFIFILAALFLKEKITRNKIFATILAVSGAVLTIYG